jgi:putative flippase GtrA
MRASRRAVWFLAVGGAATLVHWVVVVALVEGVSARPLPANVAGWLVAFCVSFFGHHRLSFRGHQAPATAAAWRFFVVSACGFMLNQAAYAVLLAKTELSYALLLGLVLAGVSLATYVASRWWVFSHHAAR